jgi:hypothetical protein
MKRIRVLRDVDDSHRGDVLRIQEALMAADYRATEAECRDMWQQFSDGMSAGWMSVTDDDDEIVSSVRSYFETQDDDAS